MGVVLDLKISLKNLIDQGALPCSQPLLEASMHATITTLAVCSTHRFKIAFSVCAAWAWLFIAGGANAETFKVGSGARCTHATVQSAINSAAGNGVASDAILIATNSTYNQQALTISGHAVSLQGGFADCDAISPTAGVRTQLYGGVAAQPVLTLSGTQGNLILLNIELREGDGVGQSISAKGGGLAISGSNHFVLLSNARIQTSRAVDGGGIAVTGAVGSRNEIQLANSFVSTNTASRHGGGIYCQNAKLTMVSAEGSILSNSANNVGGGIYADGCDVRIAGGGAFPIILNNTAVNGGGLYATNASTVELYSLSATALTRIENNASSSGGGALYLTNDAQVNANEIVWRNNSAFDGAVAFVFDDNASAETALRLNDRAPAGAPLVCAPGALCSEWVGNRAQNTDSTLVNSSNSSGVSVSALSGRAAVRLNRVSIHGNQGGSILRGIAANPANVSVYLGNSELYGNVSLGGGTVGLITGQSLVCEHLSMAGNTVNSPALIHGFNSNTTLRMIAANQPGRRLAAQSGAGVMDTQFLIANDLSGIPATVNNLQLDPLFVGTTDLRLQVTSPAIDYANTALTGVDLLGMPRPVDIASIPNEFGAVDVGAYEMSLAATEAIFASGFE
jgi:predicted outer membrane repeat protein